MESKNRSDYAEIASDSMSPEETTPFVNKRNVSTRRAIKWHRWAAGISIAVGLVIGTALALTSRHREAQKIEVATPDETRPTIMYRPLCEYYDDVIPTVIQTAMQEPSQQWSPQACYKAEQQRSFRPFAPRETVELNNYGAPDAILKVNFSQLAFPDREHPILGFGGAFTEASALNYGRLTQYGKDAVMELLFGREGLGYSLGRVHINSCDFSVKSYTFDETEDDFDLEDFDVGVHHDAETGMVGMALRATSVFRDAWSSEDGVDGVLHMYASPWSPPAWMKKPTWQDRKRNGTAVHAKRMTYSAFPNCLREGVGKNSRYAKTWALYFSKFIAAYKNLGLPMWAVTVQNEPEFAAPWEACAFTPKTERDFVAYHLGPRLEKDHPDVKLFVFDHNKDHVNKWAATLLNASSSAAKYVDGTAYHWYAGGMDRLLDGAIGQANMHRLQDNLEKYGIKNSHLILGSESCHCPTTGYAGGDIEVYWARAERYAHTILADLAAGSNGWLEWNLILDGIGGPNHLGNLCEATLLAVPHRAKGVGKSIPPLPDFEKHSPMGNASVGDGRTREELNSLGFPAKYLDVGVAVQPIYFYMGHISRYVRPGSLAVMGLVNQASGPGRIFRPEGSVVAGGGMNDLARTGIELTVWPCEGSTRQQLEWGEEKNKRRIQVFGHDWLGNPTKSCVGRSIDKDFKGMRLTKCNDRNAGTFDFIPLSADSEYYNVVLLNHPKIRGQCLVIEELKNNGGAYGPRGGAQVTLGNCTLESAKWKVDRATGEAISTYFADDSGDNEVCLTTGWPFLQIGAFLTPNGHASKTVVILNEARDAANLALMDDDQVLLTGAIPPRSIRTILIN